MGKPKPPYLYRINENVRNVIRGFAAAHFRDGCPTDVERWDHFCGAHVVDGTDDDDGVGLVSDRLVVESSQVTNPKCTLEMGQRRELGNEHLNGESEQ
jgi:hypothetical protein